MKRLAFTLTAMLQCLVMMSQQLDVLNIEECLRIACERSPVGRQKQYSADLLNNRVKNLTTNWLPAVALNGQATYNSETINFSSLMENLPVSIPALPLDQYKLWAEINQTIYEGGLTKTQKAIERIGYEADIQQVDVELLNVKQQVSQVYFSLLLTQKSTAILKISVGELQEQKKVVHSGVNQGVLLPENLLALEAEEIALQQRIIDLTMTSSNLFSTLSVLLDSTISDDQTIAKPADPLEINNTVNRPELLLFEKQEEKLLAGKRLVTGSDLPRFFAFSQAAYGRPGYNMVSRDFHGFYSVGLGMKWNFLHYGDSRRQKKMLDIQKDMVGIRRDSFNDQLNIQLKTAHSNLRKYDELLLQDEQLLKLRKEIAATSFAKLTLGVITSTDYLRDMNLELLANLQYENHKILRTQAAYNYLITQGKL